MNQFLTSGKHDENYGAKRETVYCFRRNVDRCSVWSEYAGMKVLLCFLSAFFQVYFCFITNHLMIDALGTVNFVPGPQISMFPSTLSRETLRFAGNKIHRSPRDQALMIFPNTVCNCVPCEKLVSPTPNEREKKMVARSGFSLSFGVGQTSCLQSGNPAGLSGVFPSYPNLNDTNSS